MSNGGTNPEGGAGGTLPIQRLEDVEAGLSALASEFTRLAAENVTYNTKLNMLEENDHRHEDNIRQIKESTIKMEIQFSAIMGKFDSLENKIFSLLQQANKDSGSERKMWLDFTKYIIGITIGVIVANQFLGR